MGLMELADPKPWIIIHNFVYPALIVICAGGLTRHTYVLQEEEDCDTKRCGAQTDYLPLQEEVMVYGGYFGEQPTESAQTDYCNSERVCELQLLPDSSNNEKQELHLTFRKFRIDVDGVQLKLDQASTTSFKDAQPIATLTRTSKPELYKTSVGNVLRIRLSGPERNDNSSGYQFQISIKRAGASLTIGEPADNESAVNKSLSPGIIAFIVIITLFVAFFVVFLIVKTVILKRNMESFQRKDDEPLSNGVLGDEGVAGSQRVNQNAYTPIPTNTDRRTNLGRQSSLEASYVMTDFPYANTPMVVLKTTEGPESPSNTRPAPPAYDEAVRYSY